MKVINYNKYWTYYTTGNTSNFMFGTFNIPEYEDSLMIYLKEDITKTNFPKDLLKDCIEEMFNDEANFLMKYFSLEQRKEYFDIIEKNIGTDAYLLYKLKFNKENITKIMNFFKQNKPIYEEDTKMNKEEYRDKENIDDPVLYVVLRNDLGLSVGQQATYISEATRYLMDEALNNSRFNMKNLLSTDLNTIILQASEKDLFEDNFIPSRYDNKQLLFTYMWDNEQRVAHHNFRLQEGKTVAFAYFGIKRDMPKFLRKLKLYGE